VKSCVIYVTNKNKISAASQTVATARIAPKICRGQPPTMCSQCSRLHPNRFTFGGFIAERVNTVFCPVEYFHDSPKAMHRFGWIKTFTDTDYIHCLRTNWQCYCTLVIITTVSSLRFANMINKRINYVTLCETIQIKNIKLLWNYPQILKIRKNRSNDTPLSASVFQIS